jgi:hypothetical protein
VTGSQHPENRTGAEVIILVPVCLSGIYVKETVCEEMLIWAEIYLIACGYEYIPSEETDKTRLSLSMVLNTVILIIRLLALIS